LTSQNTKGRILVVDDESDITLTLKAGVKHDIYAIAANAPFDVKSTNSGLRAGELFPVLHIGSKSVVVKTHALYSAPAFWVDTIS
jgi:hypothetical protein